MKRVALIFGIVLISMSSISAVGAATDPDVLQLRQAIQAARAEAERTMKAERDRHIGLSGDQLAACNRHQIEVNRIMKRAISRNKSQLQSFQTVAKRVQSYVTTKQLTVRQYDQLVTIVKQNYQTASARLEASDTTTFACVYQNPSSIGINVSEALRAQHTALADYRLSIQTLISAVKEVS